MLKGRGVRVIGLILAISLIFAVYPNSLVFAEEKSTSDLEEEVLSLEEKIEKNRQEMEEKAKLADTLKNHIETSGKEVENITLRIKAVEIKIEKNKTEINALESEIIEKGNILQEKDEEMGLLLRLIYVKRETPFWELFLSGKSFTEVLKEIEYLYFIEGELERIISEVEEIKKELEIKKKESEEKEGELSDFQMQLGVSKEVKKNEVTKLDMLLAKTKGEEEKYQELIKRDMAEQIRISEEIAKLHKAHLDIRYGGGKIKPGAILAWPMDKFKLSQGYGWTPYARSGVYGGRIHNGIDLYATGLDTRIFAALDGEVILVSLAKQSGGWGNLVIIKHENGLSTLYGHLSAILVKEGDKVATGQAIGFQGSTGKSDGPHLHFSVYIHLVIIKSPSYYGPLWGGTINPFGLLPKITTNY